MSESSRKKTAESVSGGRDTSQPQPGAPTKVEIRSIRSSALRPVLRMTLQLLLWAIALRITGAAHWMQWLSWGLLALSIGVTLVTALVLRVRSPELLRRHAVIEVVEVGAIIDTGSAPSERDR